MFCVLYLLAFLSFEKSWDPAFCFCMRFTSCHMLLFIFLRWLFRDTNMFFIFWRYPFTIKYMVRLQHKMVNVSWWMIYRKCKYKVEYKSKKKLPLVIAESISMYNMIHLKITQSTGISDGSCLSSVPSWVPSCVVCCARSILESKLYPLSTMSSIIFTLIYIQTIPECDIEIMVKP